MEADNQTVIMGFAYEYIYCHSQLRYGHIVFSLWMYQPTFPCPNHSAHAELISQGHMPKVIGYSTYIKLKVS